MENHSPSSTELPFKQGFVDKMINVIEQRLLNRIKENPEKYSFTTTNPNAEIKLYTVPEIAKKLRVSDATVRTLCHDGKLSYTRPGKRAMMITEEQFKNYLNSVTEDG